MRVFFFFVVVVVIVSAGCGGLRADPRIREMRRTPVNGPATVTSFQFDSDGRVVDVEEDTDGVVRSWEFTWEPPSFLTGNKLTELVVVDEGAGTENTYRFTRDEKQDLAHIDVSGDDDCSIDLTHEGGDLTRIVEARESSTTTTTFGIDTDGVNAIDVVTEDDDVGDSEFHVDIERLDIGDPVKITETGDDFETATITPHYVGDTHSFDQLVLEQGVFKATQVFSYGGPDGLVDEVHVDGGADGADDPIVDFEFDYDDGESTAYDLTPNGVYFIAFLFDMKGRTNGSLFADMEERQVVPTW